ncbi:MAG: hypothetical protein DRH03_00705 [Deltaproteobacteria bacterium]|nr:MAG: hypothetical protein DRH03_00705 [Deltaproteobacteria bacterium]
MQYCKKICIFCLFLLFCVSGASLSLAQDKPQTSVSKKNFRILVLNSYHRTHPWTEAINQALQDTISAADFKVDWHFEYMDSKRFKPAAIFPSLEELYQKKYRDYHFNLIITTDNNALDFIIPRRQKLFPKVPIAFCGVNDFTPDNIYGIKRITGVVEAADFKGTIELALKLQPNVKFVAVVCDNTPTGEAHQNVFRKIARNFAGQVEFIELFNKTLSELVVALKNLPDESVVLELSFFRDREGKCFSVREQAALIIENSRCPVYTAWDFFLGLGVAGGVMVSGRTQGESVARLAMQILNGEEPGNIPVLTDNINVPMLDYNVIKKFHIPISRIPAGTIMINQPHSFYEQNKMIIWQTAVVILILLFLISILIVIIIKRRRFAERLKLFNEQLEQTVAAKRRKLHYSENRFRLMMESMNDPVYVCSSDFLIEYMNPEMIKMVGRDAVNEVCFQTIFGFTERCPWCESTHDSRGKRFESDILNPNDKHYYHILHSPIINFDDTVSNMIIFRDTTAIKKLESQLLQVQKMESIGTLAGGIAHDFNNILTAIFGYSEVVMSRHAEDSEDWHDLNEIQKSSEKAAALTQQLLTFSRNQKIEPQVINFNSFLVEMGDMIGRLLDEDINLETSLDMNVGRIMADPTQLHQIIINLLVNARDALLMSSEITGKTVKISTSEVYLDEAFNLFHDGSSPGPHLLIEISDNGCGISTEDLEHIFEPFFTTKPVGQGTGMGLASVYGIIKQNAGAIYVSSELGSWTTFKIYWPLLKVSDAAAKDADEKVAPLTLTSGSETILFAEDDESIRKIIGQKFEQNGYQVISAANGHEALEKARSHAGNIDLLFTDVIMPVIGGKELSDAMLKLYPEIKIIFVSGYLDDRIHKDILEKGIFVNKPYSFKKIVAMIRQLFDK